MLLVPGCMDGWQSKEQYVSSIQEFRQEAERFMNEDEDSPFHDADSAIHLNYYPVNKTYRVVANIERIQNGEAYELATSNGTVRPYRKFVYAKFKLNETLFKLLILKSNDEDGHLFLGFTDETSDNTTYGGGRYIDLSFEKAEQITLDFNKAYNPYCEYTYGYSCPIPPNENKLSVAIEAGEKSYK